MRRSPAVLALAFVGVALAAGEARAHIVPTGVGCSTWIDVRPRKVLVKYNVGFSSLLALEQFVRADTNKDKVIDAAEESAYLDALGAKVIAKLRFALDGKPLDWRLVSHSTAGMRGPIASVGFETYFDLEAAIDPGTGSHELVFHDGNYENEEGQQLQFVISRDGEFNELGASQPEKRAAPAGYPPTPWPFEGRDLSIKFAFMGIALEKARAEELVEPSLRGLSRTLDALSDTAARDVERDLSGLSVGEVRLRGGSPGVTGSVIDTTPTTPAATTTVSPRVKNPDDYAEKMALEVGKPFTFATLLLFMAWGAAHAKAPGHGKSMVAAYILGTKGRIWDAVRLGLIVTFTHTFVVYTFGITMVYIVHKYVSEGASQRVQTKAIFLISLISGVFLALYGLGLALKRNRALKASDAVMPKSKEAAPAAPPSVLAAPATGKRLGLVAPAKVEVAVETAHTHSHDGHTHSHSHDGHSHAHSHDGATHSHSHEGMDEDEHAALHAREAKAEVGNLRELIALGVSGGIVPCPAGIVLIVMSIKFNLDAWKTFIYLNAFSFGLGGVLIAIAVAMVFSRRYLEGALTVKRQRWLKVIPVYSALVIAGVGLVAAYEAFDPGFSKAVAKLRGPSEVSADRSRGQ